MLAFIISLASLFVAAATLYRQTSLTRALETERAAVLELKTTLVEVLDEDGDVRGTLRLPGEDASAPVAKRLALAEASVSTIQQEIASARADLKAARVELAAARDAEAKAVKTLAEVVDSGGAVLAQIRLPGAAAKPNRTPCGSLCANAFWAVDRASNTERWLCKAGQGYHCDYARPRFLDADDQCVMFERAPAPPPARGCCG